MTKEIACVGVDQSASDAAQTMKDQNVGTVLVVDCDQLKGLVTDRAIATRAVADRKDPQKVRVTDIMTKDLIGCSEDDDIMDALKVMGEKKVRRLPVVNDSSQLVGIVSISDIAREMRAGMDSMFDELTKSV
jgi:CBS domain-containing protein